MSVGEMESFGTKIRLNEWIFLTKFWKFRDKYVNLQPKLNY
jgi:hypothetical protein